jgi:4,5:9,10-diseco-3-hydroxy-5,9,17-trioxoandrosta-1(10),2-diene-4-oate hydrolase
MDELTPQVADQAELAVKQLRHQLIQERYIKVGSIDTRYWSAGTQGTPVILLHGGGGSIEVWTDRIQSLARHHRAIAFDMVGNGLSDKPALPYSVDYQLMASFVQPPFHCAN